MEQSCLLALCIARSRSDVFVEASTRGRRKLGIAVMTALALSTEFSRGDGKGDGDGSGSWMKNRKKIPDAW